MNHEASFSEFAADLRQFIADSIGAPEANGDLNARFSKLCLQLFALQFAVNLPYRRLCERMGVRPDSVENWMSIPSVPAAGFKEVAMTCLPEDRRTRTFHSSGTIANKPSRHFHSDESLEIYEASLWPWFKAHLLPGTPTSFSLVALTPTPADAPNSSLVHMFDRIRQHLGMPESVFTGTVGRESSWVISIEKTLAALNAASTKPILLLGTAFSFVHLLDELRSRSLRFSLPAGSRVMETGGYKGRSRVLPKSELLRGIKDLLGIEASFVVSEYGMSELSSQAYDGIAGTAAPRAFRFPSWARAQIISPETGREVSEGDSGLIRVLDLANVYSVMHLQTEDLGRKRQGGFDLIGRAATAEPRGCSLMPE